MENNGKNDLGKKITETFHYIQQIFVESAQLIVHMDKQFNKDFINEWNYTYGNRITRSVSSDINNPKSWIPQAIFRLYEKKSNKNIKIGITIEYWVEPVEQPILVGGKLEYIDAQTSSDHWDMWYSWFESEPKEKKIDGKEKYYLTPENNKIKEYIKKATLFAIPLTEIHTTEDIENKIYKEIIAL